MSDLNQEFDALKARREPLEGKLEKMMADETEKESSQLHQLAATNQESMGSLLAFSTILDGEFNNQARLEDLKNGLKKCTDAWTASTTQATENFQSVSKFSVELTNFHDTEVIALQNDINSFNTKLQGQITANESEQTSRQNQLNEEESNRQRMEQIRNDTQNKVNDARADYERRKKASEVLFFIPGLGQLIALALTAYNSLNNDLNNANDNLRNAQEQVNRTQDQVQQTNAKLDSLRQLSRDYASMSSLVQELEAKCQGLRQSTEKAEEHLAQVKNETAGASGVLSKCQNRADTLNYVLTKADFGTSILQTVEVASNDFALLEESEKIVKHLADNDDKQQSIHNITVEEHPNQKYLEFIQKQIEEVKAKQPSNHHLARAVAIHALKPQPNKALTGQSPGLDNVGLRQLATKLLRATA